VTEGGGEAGRGYGLGGYVGERLEGADEVPVLPHPELVGVHGHGDDRRLLEELGEEEDDDSTALARERPRAGVRSRLIGGGRRR
jgi:hypothetical protein